LGSNLYHGRTFQYVSDRERRISELTAAEIREAFERHIDPQRLAIIRAGDFGE
jgi:zinc protease